MSVPTADTASQTAVLPLLPPPTPLDGFTAEEFKTRRESLRRACPDGMVLLRGGIEADVTWSTGGFRQNSSFFYYTGVDTPGAYLLLLPENVPSSAVLRDLPASVREILFLPTRNAAAEGWTGAKLGPGAEAEQLTGITKVTDSNGFLAALVGGLKRNSVLYTVTPYGERASLTQEAALMREVARQAPPVQFRDVTLSIARQRMIKSPAEIERIAQAVTITKAGHEAARKLITSGEAKWEYEVEAAIYQAFRSRGANLGFGTIVGGGINATVLHYEDNNCPLNHGELVVVDIGARVGHYTGDLTRTYAVGGELTSRQREIYDLVHAALKNVIATFRPGDTPEAMKERNKEFLKSSSLRALDSAGKEQTMDQFMPHGLGHHLGLDVHDLGIGELPYLPGSVITVEPGIYIASEKIGVRLENDYVVTENGLELLGSVPDI